MITLAHSLGIDASHLCEAQDGHRLEKQTYDAFVRMQKAAQKDDIDISIASGFRDFTRQKLIWDQKWQGQRPLYSAQGQLLDGATLGVEQKIAAILTWSALPGASRHHWGTDLDVYDRIAINKSGQKLQLVPDEYCQNGPCSPLSQWLIEHGDTFGFYLPYRVYNGGVSAEPWHISYRPVAEKIQQLHTLSGLHDLIATEHLCGQNQILSRLPMLYQRYILNRGTNAMKGQK